MFCCGFQNKRAAIFLFCAVKWDWTLICYGAFHFILLILHIDDDLLEIS